VRISREHKNTLRGQNAGYLLRNQGVLRRTNHLVSFDTTQTPKKAASPTIVCFCGNVFTELLLSHDNGMHRQTQRLFFDITRTAQNMTCPTITLVLRVFVAGVTCLSSSCLTSKRGVHWTGPLPSNSRRYTYTYRHTDWWEGFMKYAFEMC
jgi:hypothetical protein